MKTREKAEAIVNDGTFYVEARVGRENYRNRDSNGPCRAVFRGGCSNEAADVLIRELSSCILDLIPADDEEPIDRWFMLESGGVARHDYEGDDAIVFKIPKCGFENFLVVYPEDWSFSFWEKKTDHVICTGDARIKTRGDLRRICRALNIPSPSKEESGQR